MRRTRIAAATVMVAAGFLGAVAAPAAAGKTHRLVGELDDTAFTNTVSMKVRVKHGKPKFVKRFRTSGLEGTCPLQDPLDPSMPVNSGPLEVPGKIRVRRGTKPPEYRKKTGDEFSQLVVSGTLRKKGKVSTGEVSFESGVGLSFCSGSATFEASKE